ncbi:MAG: sulfotransferase [Gemmatimonadota bacterium]|jgi:hypothetical protein
MASGALPNLIIIGAQKCGTTSLHHYLGLHPDISMSRKKELHYFTGKLGWSLGEDWYRSWFDPGKPVRGESSPGYTNFPVFTGVPERMHAHLPDARLIFMVRDPVQRTLSHYRHMVAERKEDRPLAEVLRDPGEQYTRRSQYHFQLEQYLPYYDLDRILVVQQETLLADRAGTLAHIFEWLGVDPSYRSLRFHYRRHRSDRKRRRTAFGMRIADTPPMRAAATLPEPWRWMIEDVVYWPFSRAVPRPRLDAPTLETLLDRFRDDTDRLRRLTGLPLEGWSV